jgi:3-deoxy-D-manno-octulosonic-acid transferase
MRAFYSLLLYLLIPLILLRLLWRSIKAPAYRYRWNERLAFYGQAYPKIDIWFHAVSVGEAEALFPLVRKLLQNHPEAKLLVTTTTPTGSARVKAVLRDSVDHVYLPYDTPDAVKRFIKSFSPQMAVILETEIWPNLFACCGKNNIPIYIINARLSEKSSRGYQKIPSLVHPTLAQTKLICAQTQEDATRFIAIGARREKVKMLGNIKYDVEISQITIDQGHHLKADLFSGRFVWLIASTHKGEETIFVELYKELKEKIQDLLLVIVPRHPERFGEVKKLCELHQSAVTTRTSGNAIESTTDIYLIDTMGELKMFYAAADIAFVGGSMVPTGGHNILEAAAVGVPVMFGPCMANFKEIAQRVLQQHAAIQCLNKQDIATALMTLFSKPVYRQELIANGKQFIEQNQGAIDRIYVTLEQAFIQKH